jgi:hypothetical protein
MDWARELAISKYSHVDRQREIFYLRVMWTLMGFMLEVVDMLAKVNVVGKAANVREECELMLYRNVVGM